MRKDILNAIKDLKGVKKMINKSELARRFGCSINTVNKYLEIQNTDEKVKRKYSSKLDEYKGIIIEKVDDFSANGRSIYNFIKEKGYTGSYGIVSKFIKEHKKEEQKYLYPMPSIDCISQYFRQNKGYKVSKESMITYKKHKYSVPIKYIGEYLTVSENEDTLNIYYTTDLIASHKISRKIFKL